MYSFGVLKPNNEIEPTIGSSPIAAHFSVSWTLRALMIELVE